MMNLWDLVKRLHRNHSKRQANEKNDARSSDARMESLSSSKHGHNAWRQESSKSWPPNEADYGRVKLLRDTESEWEMWTSW